jgi:hypothetical protein
MDLLVLIALGVLIYIGWMVLKSYRNMENQLRDIRQKCVPASNGATTEGMASGPDSQLVQQVSNRVVSTLEKLLLAAK